MSIIFDKFVRFTNPRTGKIEIGEFLPIAKQLLLRVIITFVLFPQTKLINMRIKKLWK